MKTSDSFIGLEIVKVMHILAFFATRALYFQNIDTSCYTSFIAKNTRTNNFCSRRFFLDSRSLVQWYVSWYITLILFESSWPSCRYPSSTLYLLSHFFCPLRSYPCKSQSVSWPNSYHWNTPLVGQPSCPSDPLLASIAGILPFLEVIPLDGSLHAGNIPLLCRI